MARMPHPCSKLTMLETIWVIMTDSTVDSGGTSACLPHQTTRSPSYRLLADRLSQHGCCQVLDDHPAGKDTDRHNYGRKMMLGGLPASLPGRLTDSTVWSEDRI